MHEIEQSTVQSAPFGASDDYLKEKSPTALKA